MNNMMLSVLPVGNGIVTNEKASLLLSEKLPDNVRPGMLLTFSELPDISLLNNKNLFELSLTLPNGEKIQVKAKINVPINIVDTEKTNLALRVTQDGNLQFVTNRETKNISDNVFSNISSVIKSEAKSTVSSVATPITETALVTTPVNISATTTSTISVATSTLTTISNVVTYPTKLMPVLDKMMQEEDIPTDIKKWVGEIMVDAEVVAKLKVFENNGDNDDIFATIKRTLRNFRYILPEQKEILKQQLVKDIENLVGKTFEAKFYYEEGNVKVPTLETPLGKMFAEAMPKLTNDEIVQMEVLKVNLGNKPELLRIIDNFGKHLLSFLPDENRQLSSLFNLLQTPNNEPTFLVKLLSPLLKQVDGENYVVDLLQKVVGDKTNILADMYNYYRAVQSENVKDWIGDSLYKEIATSVSGKDILQNVEQLMQSSLKELPLWKIVEFPFFDGSQLFNWRISVKKNNDDAENEKNKRNNDEVRFVIDTEFSKLGAFQFDGFALKKQKRFDLIIRTSLKQSEDFCANIMALFKKSLSDLDYSGTIKINQNETFLKPYMAENKVVDGVYI